MNFILSIFLLFTTHLCVAQNYFSDHFGGKIGLILDIGTHQNSLGIELNAFYTDHFFQINLGNRFTFHHKSLGKRKNFFENRTNFGGLLFAGKKNTESDFDISNLNHQTSFNTGIGYQYLYYWDNAQTSQFSGAFALHIREFSIYWENDIFGGQTKDRFRTNDIKLSFHKERLKLLLGVQLWTGETAGAPYERYSMPKCVSGHKILENLPYGKTSHGILFGEAKVDMGLLQVAIAKIGWDSELVRHAVQNRFAHDLFFLPKKFPRNTPHYPMLGADGCAVFDKSERRKDLFFFQIGLN